MVIDNVRHELTKQWTKLADKFREILKNPKPGDWPEYIKTKNDIQEIKANHERSAKKRPL